MSNTDKGLAVLAVLGFVGAIIAGFFGALLASIVMLALLPISWLAWLTLEVISSKRVIANLKSQVISPKQPETTLVWRHKYLDEPLKITVTQRNRRRISSDFLLWERCTLVLWVFVSPRGEGLRRDGATSRYLLAHYTSALPTKSYTDFFCLRYSEKKTWEIRSADGKGSPPTKRIELTDGLPTGWHHFMIAWDKQEQILAFQINGSKGPNTLPKDAIQFLPEKAAQEVTVGGWVGDNEDSYCETSLFGLWMVDEYLESTHPAVKEHLSHKPRLDH